MPLSLQRFLRHLRQKQAADPVVAACPPCQGQSRARLARDERGVAAIEFAFIAPIMIALLLGIIDVSNAVSMNWRMVQLNRTLADLTSQSKIITDAEVAKIFAASRATLTPHTGPQPRMEIASVVVNGSGVPRVCWVYKKDDDNIGTVSAGETLNVGDVVVLPRPEMYEASRSYIMTIVHMSYQSYIDSDFRMSSKWAYLRPRSGIIGGPSGAEQVARNSTANAC